MHRYDLMNDVMSVGLHRVWKDEFVRKLGPFVTPGWLNHVSTRCACVDCIVRQIDLPGCSTSLAVLVTLHSEFAS